MEPDRTGVAKFKEKLNPLWCDIRLQDAVFESLYSLAYDSYKKTKMQIQKRSHMGLKSNFQEYVENEGRMLLFANANYILNRAREVGPILEQIRRTPIFRLTQLQRSLEGWKYGPRPPYFTRLTPESTLNALSSMQTLYSIPIQKSPLA